MPTIVPTTFYCIRIVKISYLRYDLYTFLKLDFLTLQNRILILSIENLKIFIEVNKFKKVVFK